MAVKKKETKTTKDKAKVSGDETKLSKLESIYDSVKSTYGSGSIIKMDDPVADQVLDVDFYPSGLAAFDYVTGGGSPKGRITELVGWESTGKTSLGFQQIAAIQFLKIFLGVSDYAIGIIDMEHAIDMLWLHKLGVSNKNLLISQPSGGEESFQIAEKLIDGKIDYLLVDSVAALIPIQEQELSKSQKAKGVDSTIGTNQPGTHAKMMSQGLRILNPKISASGTAVTFVNQYREKVGVMFGDPRTPTGGNALKFFASLRLDIRKKVESNVEIVSNSACIAKALKNKVGIPFRTMDEKAVKVDFTTGFMITDSLIWTIDKLTPSFKSGNWYVIGEKKFQGAAKFSEALISDNGMLVECLHGIKDAFPKFNVDFYKEYIPFAAKRFENVE